MEATIEDVVSCSDIPLSIIIIGVGEGPFDDCEVLDADEAPLIDYNGKRQTRDCVQFVPFRQYKDSYKDFSLQVLAEIPKQIKDFFELKGITPKNYKSQQLRNIQREQQLLKKNLKRNSKKADAPYLIDIKKKFIDELTALGFNKEDTQLVVNKGLYSLDRNIATDQLSQLKTNPDILAEQKQEIERMRKEKLEQERIQKQNEDLLNKFDDERDYFKYPLPLLAPKDFKPLKKHRELCKICYDNRIDMLIRPC